MPITDDGWTRSHLCEASGCIDVTADSLGVLIRDTDTMLELRFTDADWLAFVAGVKAGDFDQVVPS